MKITWLGHGTFELEWGSGKKLVLDPWIEGNPSYPKSHKFTAIDLLAVTHGHFDHIHDAVPLAKKYKPEVIGIFELCGWLESQGAKNCKPMNKGGTQGFFDGEDQIRLTMTHAVHSCGIVDAGKIIYGGEAAGFVLRFADHRVIYFSGDTDVFSDMDLIRELYKPDLAMIPVGDLFTMGPQQAAKACALIGAKRIIPMHFNSMPALTGTPAALRTLIAPGGPEIWELTPGETVLW